MESSFRVRLPSASHVGIFGSALSCLARCQTAYSLQRFSEAGAKDNSAFEGIWLAASASSLTLSIQNLGCVAEISFPRAFFSREQGGRLEAPPGRTLSVSVDPVLWWPVFRHAVGSAGAAANVERRRAHPGTPSGPKAPSNASGGVPVEQLEIRADTRDRELVLDAVASVGYALGRKARPPVGFHDNRHWRFQFRFQALMRYQALSLNERSAPEHYRCRMRFAPRVFLEALSNMHRRVVHLHFYFEQHQLRLASAVTEQLARHYGERPDSRIVSLHTQVKIDGSELDVYEGFAQFFQEAGTNQNLDDAENRSAFETSISSGRTVFVVPLRPFKAWLELSQRLQCSVWMLYESGGELMLRLEKAPATDYAQHLSAATDAQSVMGDTWPADFTDDSQLLSSLLSADMQLNIRGSASLTSALSSLGQAQHGTWLVAASARNSSAALEHTHNQNDASRAALIAAPCIANGSDRLPFGSSSLLHVDEAARDIPQAALFADHSRTASPVLNSGDNTESDDESERSVGGTPPPVASFIADVWPS